jgi:O-antigen ligase
LTPVPFNLRHKTVWPLALVALLAVLSGVALALAGPEAFLLRAGVVGAVIALLATLPRPVWLLWLTLVSVPLLTVQINLGFQVLTLPEALFYAAFGIWLLRQLLRRRLTLRRSPMNLPATLFGAFYIISFLRSPALTLQANDIGGDKLLYAILVGLLMYLLVSNALDSRRDILILISAWPIAGLLASVIGFQYYLSGQRLYDRLVSTLSQEHGPYLLYISALLLGILAVGDEAGGGTEDGGRRYRAHRGAIWLLLALFGVQMFLNGYRGVWATMALIFLGYLAWNFKRRWQVALALVLMLAMAGWVVLNASLPAGLELPSVLERALNSFSSDDLAAGARMLAWRFALELGGESPILGLGLNAFRERYLRLALPPALTMGERGIAAHNMYLDMLVEVGLLGLAAFVWLFVAAFRRQRELLRLTAGDCQLYGVVVGLSFMLLSFLVWGFTNSPLHKLLTANLNIFAALGLLNSIYAVTTQSRLKPFLQAEAESRDDRRGTTGDGGPP